MIIFIPLLGWPVLMGLAALGALVALLGLVTRARGTLWRLAGFGLLLGLLAGPQWVRQTTRPLPDVALVALDQSQSMQIGNRTAMGNVALANLQAQAAKLSGLTLRVVTLPPADTGGTALFDALAEALATIPPAQLAGVVVITDGQVSDVPKTLPFTAPLTALLTAKAEETDRELRLVAAPAYGLVGKNASLQLAVYDHGAVDDGLLVPLSVTEDGALIWQGMVAAGQSIIINVPVRHAGPAVITASVAVLPGEVSPVNDQVAFPLNGITKKLEVLLISGNPNQSERSWRLLLKSDPAVELVHFTILRTRGEVVDAPPDALALVPFPVAQLFDADIAKFDLIVLDEFDSNGLLPPEYLGNIARYVQNGGALLVQVGPEFEGAQSLAGTPLGAVLPAQPAKPGTITAPFAPQITGIGARHPVSAPLGGTTLPPWQRLEAATTASGAVLMTGGPQHWPLLVLASALKGRVGMLLSDQLWLWSKGGAHDGPALPLLRRIVHWLLREPALEPEFLAAKITDGHLEITRQTLGADNPGPAYVTLPDGELATLTLHQSAPGVYRASQLATMPGVWRVRTGGLSAAAVLSFANVQEFQSLAASGVPLRPLAHEVWLGRAPVPELASMLHRPGATQVTGVRDVPLLPALPAMLLAMVLLAAGWWRERG